MSKRKLTYKDFLNYFSNNLQNKDKHDFEKELMRDVFEEEAYDGLSRLNEDELRNDVAELKAGIFHRTEKNRRIVPVWFRYAASVIILLGVGITVVYLNSQYWQDSILKEQVSHEIEIADSVIIEAERQMQKLDKKSDTTKKEPEQLIAESKESIERSEIKPEETKPLIVEDEVIVAEDLKIYDDTEADLDETIEITEFEEDENIEEVIIIAESPARKEGVANAVVTVEAKDLTESYEDKNGELSVDSEVITSLEGNVNGVIVEKSKDEKSVNSLSKKGSRKTRSYKLNEYESKNSFNYKTINGVIVGAEDDLSIPGVSIILKDNPSIGTISDLDGKFQLTVPKDDEELMTLIASFVGMKTQEIFLNDDSTLLVYMEPEVLAMDEVVVTGYGAGEKRDEISTSISAKPPASLIKSKYKKQILEELDYSKFSGFPGKHKIKVSFTVGEDGSLFNFNFSNTPDAMFSNEIKRIILELGNWVPATENNINVSSKVKLVLKVEIE